MKELVELRPSTTLAERMCEANRNGHGGTFTYLVAHPDGFHSVTCLIDSNLRITVDRDMVDQYPDWDTVRVIEQPETVDELRAAGWPEDQVELRRKVMPLLEGFKKTKAEFEAAVAAL
ncbi:hypothetical protein [Bradyrhizobium jicamae]|uniref:hypothetical protein n=1 Tax=Bradyrhizobium jicamae TaxID=280332 RepID=UPI001BA6296E|nr:hypothetical protein [Bradyrhizobium jicamae]MBR0934854.1 hypothetical protein [Bradyrhizobium jicamae]